MDKLQQVNRANIGYGSTFYESASLKKAAKMYHKTLCKLLREDKEIQGLVSTGSSGTAIVTAMLMLELPINVPHIHICKPGDGHGHSGAVSGHNCGIKGRLVFIDDFISSGRSIQHCVTVLHDWCKATAELTYAIVGNVAGHADIGEVQAIWVGNKFSVKPAKPVDKSKKS